MALYFDIEAIKGRSLSADRRTVTVDLTASVTDDVMLSMNASLAGKLVETLAALCDRAGVNLSPKTKDGEYMKFEKVAVNLDAAGSMLLIDFDRGTPHHVGLAISIEKCEALVQTLTRAAEVARALRRIETRQ